MHAEAILRAQQKERSFSPMPRRNLARRFEPRYGVSNSMVEEEAKWLGREAEDYETCSPAQVTDWLKERHASCRRRWKELQLLLGHLPERERRIIHCLLFRDFHLILELYLCHVRTKHPEFVASNPPPVTLTKVADDEFGEWLFDPPTPKGDSHASSHT
jgi:hypothetical protein